MDIDDSDTTAHSHKSVPMSDIVSKSVSTWSNCYVPPRSDVSGMNISFFVIFALILEE